MYSCQVEIYLAWSLEMIASAGLLRRVIPSDDPGQFLKASHSPSHAMGGVTQEMGDLPISRVTSPI